MNKFIKVKGKKGFFTYIYNKKYLYSTYDPHKEAKKYIETLSLKNIVITFCGADYINKVLLDKNIDLILSFTIDNFDFDIFSDKLIRIHSIQQLENYLIKHNIEAKDISLVVWQPLLESNTDFLEILKKIKNVIYKSTFSSKTEKIFDKVEKRNFFHNTIKSNKISVLLKSSSKYNTLAILIASGASLINYVGFLKKNKTFLVFALPSALPFLFAHSIRVDYIIVVDPGYGSFYHLIKYKNFSKIITTLTVTPSIFNITHLEPIIFNYNTDNEKKLFGSFPNIVTSPAEGSVAINSLRILHQLGFENVLLLGQDFSFYNKRMHVAGGSFESEYLQRTNYFNSLDSYIKQHETASTPINITIENKKYQTTLPLKIYFDHFINTKFPINILLSDNCYNPLDKKIKKINIDNLTFFDNKIDITIKEFTSFGLFKKEFLKKFS